MSRERIPVTTRYGTTNQSSYKHLDEEEQNRIVRGSLSHASTFEENYEFHVSTDLDSLVAERQLLCALPQPLLDSLIPLIQRFDFLLLRSII